MSKIDDYIKKQQDKGFSDDKIKSKLKKQGYSQSAISKAFTKSSSTKSSSKKTQQPKEIKPSKNEKPPKSNQPLQSKKIPEKTPIKKTPLSPTHKTIFLIFFVIIRPTIREYILIGNIDSSRGSTTS